MENKPKKILLIEDNPGDARLIREMLVEAKYGGFEMEQSPRLSSGLALLSRAPFDVVLLDLGLPDSQGIETLVKTKNQAPHIPIVIMTGLTDESLGISAVREGAQDYLVKGQVDSNLLARTLRYAIERKRAELALEEYQERLRSLASQVSLAEESERRRIATDVHDRMSQTLALCTMRLSALLKSTSSPEPDGTLKEIYDALQELAAETRSLTYELSPPVLYDFGLETAVKGLCKRTAEKHNLTVLYEDNEQTKPLEKDIRVELYRMTRELLVNAVKHARAKCIKVGIPRSDTAVKITVQDNGVGFDTKILAPAHGGSGFGLFSIRERLDYMGGHIEAESKKGQGSRITLVTPLK